MKQKLYETVQKCGLSLLILKSDNASVQLISLVWCYLEDINRYGLEYRTTLKENKSNANKNS